MAPRAVCYVSSRALLAAADALPSNIGRASAIHELIDAFSLLSADGDASGCAQLIASAPASREQLLSFHDEDLVDALLDPADDASDSDRGSSPPKRRKLDDTHGLIDDCPLFPGTAAYVKEVAGASIRAATELRDGKFDVAINWHGGRHHAKRSEVAGFCYVGDIPLAISVIRGPSATRTTRINRVLYIDLDLHHGDGPASSYSSTKNVLTLSIHLHAPLFYPATGALDSTGPAKSQSAYHDLNLACEPGLSTPSLLRLFNSCILPVMTTYQPQAIVVQCGCDGLAGDPCAEWNLSLEGMGKCVSWILQHADAHKAKVLLLGGGGYSNVSAARCYAYLTSIAIGTPLPLDTPIPASVDYADYAPYFTLDVPAGNRTDENNETTLVRLETAFLGYVRKLREKYPGTAS